MSQQRRKQAISVPLDREGHLRRLADWSPEVAAELAAGEQITLTPAHWEILEIIRDYYATYQVSPPMRVLVKVVGERLGSAKGRSIHLMLLFPGKTLRLINRIAGLPKPVNCD